MCCVIYKCYLNRVKVLFCMPVVCEWAVMLWTYYVYVYIVCLMIIQSHLERILLLTFYHIIMGLGVWAHMKAIFSVPWEPSPQYHYDDSEWYKLNHEYPWIQKREETEKLKIDLGIRTTQASMGRGLVVYCLQCKVIKPDRCHHCSRCGVCVLKMDHHCPWINNCVGFHNYKYFLLFAFYTFLYCIYVPATSVRFVIAYFTGLYEGVDVPGDVNSIQITVMNIVVILVGLALIPLLHLHWQLASANTTTLENTRPVEQVGKPPDPRIFDLGWRENLIHTFGRSKLLWLIPVFTSVGDGAHFPLREDHILKTAEGLNMSVN